jgi:hypothetical protein
MTTLRTTGTVRNYVSEANGWEAAVHGEAAVCVEFEELLALGNSAFEAIGRWDAIWHQKVNGGAIPFDAAAESQILGLYALWLTPSPSLLREVDRFERAGYPLVGAEPFRRHCEDATGLTTPDDEFFGEELIPHQDEALAAHRRGETVEFENMGDWPKPADAAIS